MKIYKSLILTTILFSLSFVAKAQDKTDVNYQSLVPQTFLPDGTQFLSWSDLTHYTRTYHVNQNNPNASDENDGTEEHPFRSINHAAQIVKSGERVRIHSGIYRELVRPRFSGEGQDKMIAYEAATGEQVIIRGSRVISTKWELSVDPNDSLNSLGNQKLNLEWGFPSNIFSKHLSMTTLPDDMFDYGYFPFQLPNVSNEEFNLMNWATKWKGRIPYSLPRGLLFQEGQRMVQLSTYEDLVHLPGSFWVAPGGKTIHIHPFGNSNPNDQLFEAAVQPHIIQPQTTGLGFIRVSGLILEHCANGFLRTGVGALFTMGGHHWIIEGNKVQHINSMGIEIGYQAYEKRDHRYSQRTDPDLGHNIVRRNSISDCGTAGIRGLNVSNALVEENNIYDCGWQDVEFHFEVAGIKLLTARGTLVRKNHISHIQGGCGIWLDWGNQNSRITGNVLQDINTVQGAIFIEASQIPNLVDNNVLWKINGQGIRLGDTDNAIVAHNLLGKVSEELVAAKVATDRSVNGQKVTSKGNQFVNNFVVDQEKPIHFDDPNNVADYNVYVSTHSGQAAMKDSGGHSVDIKGKFSFDEEHLLLTWKSDYPLPAVPLLKNCELDFFRLKRTPNQNVPGPFIEMENEVTLQLSDTPEMISFQ